MTTSQPRRMLLVAAIGCLAGVACSRPTIEPLVLDGPQLQISNDTADEWRDVEIWLNRYFRATVRSIPAHSRYKVPLSSFVSGYAQKFDFGRMQITALRLTAKHADGTPVELNKQFEDSGLAGALGGKR